MIVSREAARLSGLQTYNTGLPCSHGHMSDRRASKGDCVQCHREAAKLWRQQNPERRKAHDRQYAVRQSHVIAANAKKRYWAKPDKARENARKWYAANEEKIAAYRAATRVRASERQRTNYRSDPAKFRERTRRWFKNNPQKTAEYNAKRRARILAAEGSYTGAEILNLGGLQGWLCVNCTRDIREHWHADHIVPLSKGGSNWIRNIQLLCPSCNSSKGAEDPIVWAQANGRLL